MNVFTSNSIVTLDNKGYDYVSIKAGSTYFICPILNISVKHNVDCSIYKTLGGNFAVTTFLDKPCILSLTGLVTVSPSMLCPESNLPTLDKLLLFYKANKVSSKHNHLVTVAIRNSTYNCVMLNLSYSSILKYPYLVSFQLNLVGVPNE